MSHPILNPQGKEIHVAQWVLAKLRRFGLLEWDRQLRRHRISERWDEMKEILRTQDCGPRASAGCINYADTGHQPIQFLSPLYKALGPDCSGPQHPMACDCSECTEDLVLRGESPKVELRRRTEAA